jgi:hypothetical protein
VEDFSPEQRSQLLHYVTSCSRPPLLGFAALHPGHCPDLTLPFIALLSFAYRFTGLMYSPLHVTRQQGFKSSACTSGVMLPKLTLFCQWLQLA